MIDAFGRLSMTWVSCAIALVLFNHYILKQPWKEVWDIAYWQGVALIAVWVAMAWGHYQFVKVGG